MFIKLLPRYMFQEVVKVFFLTFATLTLVFFLVLSGKMVQTYSQYISFLDVLALSPYTLAMSASFTIPLAMLAATTMVYGRMTQEKEILILRIAGVHFHRMFQPAFILGLFLCGICFYINANLVPTCWVKQQQLWNRAIEIIVSAHFSSEETTIDFIPNFQIYYRKLEQGKFHGLVITHVVDGEIKESIIARTGNLEYDKGRELLTFYLQNGTITYGKHKNFFFQEISLPIDLDNRDTKFVSDRSKYKKFSELHSEIKVLEQKKIKLDKELAVSPNNPEIKNERKIISRKLVSHRRYWHRCIVNAFTPFLVVFLGAPLGILISHRNRLVSFTIASLPIILIYYPLQIVGRSMAESEKISPFWGEWFATFVIVFLGLGIVAWIYRK